jgi:anaerobic magnesium-protoporphyrin IX monomethyl ester cyclase
MKILIVVPTEGYDTDRFQFKTSGDFPTGLAYIAAALKQAGHEVHGLNPNNDVSFDSPREMLAHKLGEKLGEASYDVVCFGGLCIHFQFMEAAVQLTRKHSPDSIVICGGGIITDDAEFMFKTLRPDFCISGQGEETVVQLLQAVESSPGEYGHIPNLGYWEGNEARFTPTSFNYGNIDERAFPDYSLFDMADMLDRGGLHNKGLFRYTRNNPRVMSIITALGCPFKCTFCVHNTIQRYRERSIDRIMEEIRQLYDSYRFNILIVLDELFAIKKDRFRAFCQEMIKNRERYGWDFDWLFQTHAKAALTLEDLELLKKAGCYYFSYGIESASQNILDSMEKRTNPGQILNAVELSRQAGIGFGGNFIFGDVAETIETATQSLSFFQQHCQDLHVNLGIVHPYPGSKIFDDYCEEQGFDDRDKLAFYRNIDQTYINLTTMDDNTWSLVCRSLFILTTHRWEQITSAASCVEEPDSPNAEWAEKLDQKVYRITATCPHCAETHVFREALGFTSREQALESAKQHKFIFSLPHQMPDDPREAEGVEAFNRVFDKIDTSQNLGHDFFNTGCPSCHRKFNVSISR